MKKFRPGVSFSDFVITDSMVSRTRMPTESNVDYRRGWLLFMGILVLFGTLFVRSAMLQVFYGERYRLLSDENRVKKIKLQAPRGKILDRNGQILAENKQIMTLLEPDKIVVDKWQRVYPASASAAHVVGYVGEVGAEEVGLLKENGGKYEARDVIGRSGIEVYYEERLRGMDGGRLVEVDNAGNIVRELGRAEPVVGQDVKLALDTNLEQKAFEAMEGKKGAVVATDPKTGEILILVSSPSFDANLFVPTESKGSSVNDEKVSKVLLDTNLPMFNRAIGAVYPPGSTFKMITTVAAIAEGKVGSDFTFTDTGIIRVGQFNYTNWAYNKNGKLEGVVGFSTAIKRSTDTFFYKVGELTTPELMAKWAVNFGLGEKTGVDLPGEVSGLIPTPNWKTETRGETWFLGNTYHMAIGQGDVLATPMQINLMTATLANGGKKCKPHMLANAIPECDQVEIPEVAAAAVKEGMVGACSPGGTAFPLFGFSPTIACKTGTAEYVAENGKVRSHGWLTAYAPVDEPKIAVTVVFEGGGEGSNVAAPVVRKILSEYFGVEDHYNYAAIPREPSE